MKKFLVPILCLAIVSTSAHAAGDPLTGGGNTKKNVAVVHNIVSDKLPTRLLKTIKKEYKDYWITRLYREEANGKISYHITVENPDQIVTLSAATTSWSVVRVHAKEQDAL